MSRKVHNALEHLGKPPASRPPSLQPSGPNIQPIDRYSTACNRPASTGDTEPPNAAPAQKLGRRTAKRILAAAAANQDGDDGQETTGERFLWDPILPGFGIRVQPSGRQVYIVQYRERGRTRRRAIGAVAETDTRTARRRARKLLSDVKIGLGVVDPFAPVALPTTLSFADYVDRFWEAYARRWAPRTQASSRKLIDRLLVPEFGKVPLTEITRSMVLKWRDSMGERPGTANRVLPVLSVMMTTAETMGLRPRRSNPCRNVTRFPTKTIERFLSLDELARLGAVLNCFEDDHPQDAAIVRLLVLTGARRQEIESLRWSYLDGSFAHLPGGLPLPDRPLYPLRSRPASLENR